MSRYSAFISYSHSDQAVARWLHRAIETFTIPRALIGTPSEMGPLSRRLAPVFRDRDELPASGDLGQALRSALTESHCQIVLCSPRAAASKWVNEEILSFKRLHGEARTFALITRGEPYAGGDLECFPPALRFRLAPDGSLSDQPAEPIAADIRPGKDGRRLALLKLVAGITGVPLDALVRRDAARRQRRLAIVACASLTIALITIGLAIYAESQRRVAERQRRLADRSLAFLVDTFSIANPATENPRTITALTILGRASRRVTSELSDEPAVSARLLGTTGEIYYNLGLNKEAERDLRASMALEPAKSDGRAAALLKLSDLAYNRGDPRGAAALIHAAEQAAVTASASDSPIQAKMVEQRSKVAILEGRYDAAAAGFDKAARLLQNVAGDHRASIAQLWTSEAQALVHAKRIAAARALFAKVTALTVAKFGTAHVATARALQNEALTNFESGDQGRAEDQIERALATFDKVLDHDHPSTAAALILLGRIRTARGDVPGARDALGRARAIYVALYGARNVAVADVDFYAAEAAARAGDVPAALRLLATTKSIYDARYGPDDPDQVELLMLRSRIMAAARRTGEAHRDCAAALALQSRLNPRDPQIAGMRTVCAALAGRS